MFDVADFPLLEVIPHPKPLVLQKRLLHDGRLKLLIDAAEGGFR